MTTEHDLIETIWRRYDFLKALQKDTKTKNELIEELGYSEQTVYKRIRELKKQNLVQQTQNEYRLTLYGHLAINKFNKIENTSKYTELLTDTNLNKELDIEIIQEATFLQRKGNNPDNLLNYFDEKLRNSKLVQSFTSTLFSPSRIDTYEQQIEEKNLDIEVVIQSDIYEYLLSEHRNTVISIMDSGSVQGWVTEEKIPFGVVILDNEEIFINAFDSPRDTTQGTISMKGLIHTTSTPAVNWAKQKMKEYKKESKQIQRKELTGKY